jgi:Xaa-Pro aminopeptidase
MPFSGNYDGYELDTSFIEEAHHTNPRRLYSTYGADWQYRVDHERMRRERLERARAEMEADDLGAIIVFAGANVRYLTGSYQGNWKYNINIRYAVLPRDGEPYLFETAGSDMRNAMLDLPWMKDRIRPAMTWQWAEGAVSDMADKMVASVMEVLKEHGVEKEKIGVDNLDFPALHAFEKAGLRVVNGWPAMSRARVVKTPDEIEQIKMSAAIGDAAMWHIKHEWLKPGVTERQIEAKVHEFMLDRGCEIIYVIIIDINAVGPGGYYVDFVRTLKCAGKMTQQEIDLYRETYDSLYAGMENLRPGMTSADVVSKFPEYDDDTYGTVTLQQFAHSIGITLYEGMWMSRAYSLKYPAEIKENMYFAIETFAGHPGLPQTCRLEENVLVSKDGPVIFTKMEHMEEAVGDYRVGDFHHPSLLGYPTHK